jgi:hypothetical protein
MFSSSLAPKVVLYAKEALNNPVVVNIGRSGILIIVRCSKYEC